MDRITKYSYFILFIVAVAQLWPRYVFDIAGDKFVYQFYIECFAQTLADGVIRPSWCDRANYGIGTPVFFFYFPFSYYITSLIYPLKSIGLISIEGVFLLKLILCNVLFAFTLHAWLKRHSPAKYALILTCVLLYVPYRLELFYFRAAHAELLAMALFPLWIMAVEDIIEKNKSWLGLAMLMGITVLIHTQTTLLFGIIVLLYALFYARDIKVFIPIAKAGVVGILLAAYYVIPAGYYQQFAWGADGVHYDANSVNRYIKLHDFHSARLMLIVLSMISFAFFCGLLALYLTGKKVAALSLRIKAWLLCFLVCAILYSPLIAPIFDNIKIVRTVFFPWRIQVVFIPVLSILLLHYALKVRQAEDKHIKIADVLILIVFLNILQPFAAKVVKPDQEDKINYIVQDMIAPNTEYYPIFVPKGYGASELFQQRDAEVIQGAAQIKKKEKISDLVRLELRAEEDATIRLNQHYFPSWAAYAGGKELHSYPDEMGMLLIDVPAKTTEVLVRNQPYRHGPWWVMISPFISLAAVMAWFVLYWRQRRLPA